MGDLIDREKVTDVFAELVLYAVLDGATKSYANGLSDAYNLICQLPSAEPETCAYWDRESNFCALHRPSAQPERKKGKWLPDTNNYIEERFVCSVCGRSYKVDTCMGKPMWDFCPGCGADMREEKSNGD